MKICHKRELETKPVRGFELETAGGPLPVLLLLQHDTPRAYRNSCPHTGIPLDWTPGEFMDITGKLLQCATHGALFRPADGYCIAGPCQGQSLQALNVTEIGEEIHLMED